MSSFQRIDHQYGSYLSSTTFVDHAKEIWHKADAWQIRNGDIYLRLPGNAVVKMSDVTVHKNHNDIWVLHTDIESRQSMDTSMWMNINRFNTTESKDQTPSLDSAHPAHSSHSQQPTQSGQSTDSHAVTGLVLLARFDQQVHSNADEKAESETGSSTIDNDATACSADS